MGEDIRADGTCDFVLINGNIIALSQDSPSARAVVARDGVIVAVGSDSEILALAGPRTTVIDCKGRCVVPGFYDAHIHLLACAAKRLSVDCSPPGVRSIRHIQDLIFAHAQTAPDGTWIRAGNYDESRLAEKRHPTRWDLDAVAPRHPVKLQHRSLHAYVLNTVALRSANLEPVSGETATTFPGVKVKTDPQTGQPSGLVYDHTGYLSQSLPPIPETDLRSALRDVLSDLLAHGITSVQDATFRNGVPEWERLHQLCSERGLRPRIGFMVGRPYLDDMIARGIRPGSGDEWLSIGAVKIILVETRGSFEPAPDLLSEQVWQAHRNGFQVAIHAVEESEICVAAEALGEPIRDNPTRGHRIEHCSVLPPGLCERLAELKVAVCTQPGFIFESGDRYLADVETERQPFLYAIKRLLDNRVAVGAGSDAPVASVSPLTGIGAAITRLSSRGNPVGESERISVEQALRLYTSGSASICRAYHRTGSIEPGKLADMVILSEDLTILPAAAIQDVEVDTTIVGGRLAWQRGF